MKKTFASLLFLFPILTFCQSHNRIDAVILGTFHFGETPDFRGGEYDDVLKPKRQHEIAEVVRKLAAFKPDKIFVENTPEAQKIWDKVYNEYVDRRLPTDTFILKNEIFQLGIKTAHLSRNSKGVICINYIDTADESQSSQKPFEKDWKIFFNDVNTKKPDFETFFKSNSLASSTFETFLKEHESWKKLSLRDHLIRMNTEASLRNLHYFNVLAWMDNNINGVGAELSSIEYFRNLKIIQNLYTHLGPKDDRILIIFGAAHAQILTDMLKSHPVFKIIDVESVLK